MISDELIEQLGDAGERLLADEGLGLLVQVYEAQQVSALLGTKRDDKDGREELFNAIQATRDFLGFMQQVVAKRDQLREPDHPDQDDNPDVHNLFQDKD